MKKPTYRLILLILCVSQSWIAFPQSREPVCDTLYPPSCFYQADTGMMPLIMCPPLDSLGNVPDNFMGYNIYINGELINYVPEPNIQYIVEPLQPGYYFAEVTAVYNLSPCGFPGETGESYPLSTLYIIRFGYPLDFLEDWSSGSFETNNWLTDGPNWSIIGQTGNPAPSAEFNWDPVQVDYEIGLESYPLQADSIFAGQIFLDFDLKLDNYQATGDEKMLVQVWNWESYEWQTVTEFSNADGSFDWLASHLDITPYALSQLFRIRFLAAGAYSVDIINWSIDNIHVYRECEAPTDLTVDVNYNTGGLELNWSDPAGIGPLWLYWDDGENYDAIGTGNEIEFDVAVRWTPEQLSLVEDGMLTTIAFFPNEANALYNIRVWTGAGAANLIVDQPVSDPLIGEWNEIILEDTVQVDITQELWVGYHVNALNGFPAGCDDGPAIDGYGNMMNFGGWQTLLQINPDLDYNWNIRAYIFSTDSNASPDFYAVYRWDPETGSDYSFRGYADDEYYLDDSVCLPEALLHCYRVTALYNTNGDTCESGPSNEACEVCEAINESSDEPGFNLYPNPAHDFITLESNDAMEFLTLYHNDGRMIFSKEINTYTYTLPVQDYPDGVYLLRIWTDRGMVSRKIIIMR